MVRWLYCVLALLACVGAAAAELPKAQFARIDFEFGRVLGDAPIQHAYRIKNVGTAPLRIERVALTPPLRMAAMRAQIAPGAEATIQIELDPAKLNGRYDGRVVVYTNDPAQPETTLSFEGEIVAPVELAPIPAIFLAGMRGKSATATIEIVNHEAEPLTLAPPHHSAEHFVSRLETIEDGRRYRLTIALKPDAPAGKHSENITLATSSKTIPVLTIPANTLLRERVYTFPDAVDLGALPLAAIRANPNLLRQNAQVLMVYQSGGDDFRISASTDVAGLLIKAERAASGDRQQLTIALDPKAALAAGAVQGSIVIKTNDPEFPTVRVPVSGAILAD